MENLAERRRFPRVNVGPDHTVRFKLEDQSFNGLTMTNLSAGGCCVKVLARKAERLNKGTTVSMLYLVHPRLPSVPLEATVCWLLGKQTGKADGFMIIGLEFVNPSPRFQETVDIYVRELLT